MGAPGSPQPPAPCPGPYPLWSCARQSVLERTLRSRAACSRWKQAVPKQTRYTAEEPTSRSQSVPPGRCWHSTAEKGTCRHGGGLGLAGGPWHPPHPQHSGTPDAPSTPSTLPIPISPGTPGIAGTPTLWAVAASPVPLAPRSPWHCQHPRCSQPPQHPRTPGLPAPPVTFSLTACATVRDSMRQHTVEARTCRRV